MKVLGVCAALAVIVLAACTSSGGRTANNSQCTQPEDCVYHACLCSDGYLVNARSCDRGTCLGVQAECSETCSDLGHGSWSGTDVDTHVDASVPTPPDASVTNDASSANDAGAAARECSDYFNGTLCGICGAENCCEIGAACYADSTCKLLAHCVVGCVNCSNGCGDLPFCRNSCESMFTQATVDMYEGYMGCLRPACGNCL